MRLGKNIGVGAAGLLVLASCLAGITNAVDATPTGLAAKAMPDLLAPDEGSLALFPASAAGFGARLLYDRREASSSYTVVNVGAQDIWFSGESLRPQFALALAARGSLRGGYLLDGETHTLLLAGSGGWGLSLGWRENRDGNEYESLWRSEHMVSVTHSGSDFRSREARLGAGWMMRSTSGRAFEVAMAGGVLDGTSEWWNENPLDSTAAAPRGTWDIQGGVRFEAAARTTTPHPGPLVAAHYRRDRWSARSPGRPGWTDSFEESGFQSGWRARPGAVDDVVVGIEVLRSCYERTWPWLDASGVSMEPLNRNVSTTWAGAIFISMEERVDDALILRGGVYAPFREEATEEERVWGSSEEVDVASWEVARTREVKRAVFAPEVRVGAGWRWRSLDVEAWIQNDIRWDEPFMRWAATVSF